MHNNISCVVIVVFFTYIDMIFMIFIHRSDTGRLRRLSNVSMPFFYSVCFVSAPVQPAKILVCLIFHKSHMCILHSGAHQAEEHTREKIKISVQMFKSLLDE